jgi:hypothetical protein
MSFIAIDSHSQKMLNKAVVFSIYSCLMNLYTERMALNLLILHTYQHTNGRTLEKDAGVSDEVHGSCIDNIVNEIAV